MNCAACGRPLPAVAQFCPSCGKALARSAAPPEAPPVVQPAEPEAYVLGRVPSFASEDSPYFELAGLWSRFFAMLLDSTIVTVGSVFGVLALYQIPGYAAFGTGWDTLLVIATQTFYYAVFESSLRCATPGKVALGIRVLRRNGTRVSFGRALARAIARVVPFELIAALFTDRKQCVHDLLADTIVVPRAATEPAA